ncbi:TPA: hypothetical protein SL239_005445 [Pseudomonas aeruginosa]|uniref:hypothetical protein n=1 Tax=Pseudomonas aeruginosa TaxID=287 RepID=UPI000F8601AA|nr:hypothetical protein [Pseudomonas aeruginosa]RTV25967.1 hypothetical protein DY985_20800 [Pseudomonas aeruginosa]HEJ2060505.1 hypothetical protein [Pseudomonas aeruginosa]HEJ2117003.1 hypothetical protein [Pseudomonas aeruginosa]HEJ2895711.1 hypothetical protein [Pseudomonas aeruginosa]HEJ4635168.1 hypothetical protein [Pseudomonas aeruginosa]
MADVLEIDCSECGTPYPEVTARSAAHDARLIDLVVTCRNCGNTLNAFVSLAEMSVVPNPEEETPHG